MIIPPPPEPQLVTEKDAQLVLTKIRWKPKCHYCNDTGWWDDDFLLEMGKKSRFKCTNCNAYNERYVTLPDLFESIKITQQADKIISIKREGQRVEILSKWEAIAVVAIALAIGAFTIADSYFTAQVKTEAIKAGLVQDKAGNWVKP